MRVSFRTLMGTIRAVDGVSFHLDRGETLGVVGESGCGKSVMAMSLLQLIPSPPAERITGQADFLGRDLIGLSEEEIRDIRGNRISMIFQEPMTALNPVFTIGDQISESIRLHKKLFARASREKTIELLRLVGIPAPERRFDEYPHQLSGGMRQRVMIAMALSCEPELLIADEPTTALDVTVQAQILDLIKELQVRNHMGVIMITHNLGVIAETSDRVIVMYCGRAVEVADVEIIFHNPLHPYTRLLLQSVPRLDDRGGMGRLREIPGLVPSIHDLPDGCNFHPRCDCTEAVCRRAEPALVEVEPGHLVACTLVAGACSSRGLA